MVRICDTTPNRSDRLDKTHGFCMGGGGTVTHARIWALVAQTIGQLRWFLRSRGTIRVWPASHGLRYTTFFGGDRCHAVGFFNPLLACSSMPAPGTVAAHSAGLLRRAGRSRGRHDPTLDGAATRLTWACAGQDGCVLDVCLRGRLRLIADSVAAGKRFRRCVAQGGARLAGCWRVRCIKTLVDWKRKRAGPYEQKS